MPLINLVDPVYMTDQHIMKEMQAITQFPSNFKMTMASINPIREHKMKVSYRLGDGHSYFFYNKGKFVTKRWHALREEVKKRNFKWTHDFNNLWIDLKLTDYYNDYEPTYEEYKISINHLVTRIATNPHRFKYYSRLIDADKFILKLYEHLDTKYGRI